MDGDPQFVFRFPLQPLVGMEIERKSLRFPRGPDRFRDPQTADDLMFLFRRERIGEKAVEPLIDPSGSDDAGGPEKGAEREGEPLRGVEEEDRIEPLLKKGFPKRQKRGKERFFQKMEPIDRRVVLEDLDPDRTGQNGQVGIGKRAAEIFQSGGGPKSIAQSGGGDDEDPPPFRMLRKEALQESDEFF